MASIPFVKQVRTLAGKLAAVAKRTPSLAASDLDPTAEDSGRASKLLELMALYQLLMNLHMRRWSIRLAGKYPPKFLSSPGLKSSASYFQIADTAGNGYQLVHGTQIEDRHGQPRAPDISLQTHSASPTAPVAGDVVAMWDMKLRGEVGTASTKRVTDAEFARFLLLMDWLGVPGVPSTNMPLANFPPAFEVSGLITNGTQPSEPKSVFLEEAVSVVEGFVDASTQTKPTRSDHIVYPGTPKRK